MSSYVVGELDGFLLAQSWYKILYLYAHVIRIKSVNYEEEEKQEQVDLCRSPGFLFRFIFGFLGHF